MLTIGQVYEEVVSPNRISEIWDETGMTPEQIRPLYELAMKFYVAGVVDGQKTVAHALGFEMKKGRIAG